MSKKIILFIAILLLPSSVSLAKQGCCSYHGGVSYCGSSGYYICNDGTRSPSCTCSSGYSEIISDGCSTNCSSFAEKIKELEEENKRLIEEKNDLQSDNTFFQWLILILGVITFILFCQKA
jgi:hypothetical protein